MPGKITKRWTDECIARLRSLEGATAVRASAALGRPLSSVTKMARLHGVKLVGIRESKAKNRRLEQDTQDLRT